MQTSKKVFFWSIGATILIASLVFWFSITAYSQQSKEADPTPLNIVATEDAKETLTPSAKIKKCESGNCAVLVVVDAKISDAISGELTQFKNDLTIDGYKPVVIESAFSSAEEVKKEMQKYKDSAEGAILIGNIPFAHMADPGIASNRLSGATGLLSDNYYADIQGFCDKKIGFYYDVRVCQKPALLYPYIWVGRIMPSKAGDAGIGQLRDYFKRNHAYRIGAKIDPTKIFYVVQDNMLGGLSGAMVNNEFTRRDISVLKWQSADIHTLVSTKDNKADFLAALREEYPMAIINVHGANVRHDYDVTSQDIENTKPRPMFVDLQSCSTADAQTKDGKLVSDYLAGTYLFSGSTLVVKASPIPHFESFPPQQQPFVKALAFGNSFGEAMRVDWQGAYILLGDPTLSFASQKVDAVLEVSRKDVDLGVITFEKDFNFKGGEFKTDKKTIDLTFKNVGREAVEFQPTVNSIVGGIYGVPTVLNPGQEVTVSYTAYGQQKILDEASFVPRNGQQYVEPLYILTNSKTQPILQIDFTYTAKVL